jgi:hypothetical protein
VTRLSALTSPHGYVQRVDTAQRVLDAAFDSVDELVEWHSTAEMLLEDEVLEEPRTSQVRNYSMDVLRSMIVFSGAGLDAAIKQLVQESLPDLVRINALAKRRFEEFAEKVTNARAVDGNKVLARILVSDSPQAALLTLYLESLVRPSMQSVKELRRITGAFGLNDARLNSRIGALEKGFHARNQIVHDLDLLEPSGKGERSRRDRNLEETVGICHDILNAGQEIINAVDDSLAVRYGKRLKLSDIPSAQTSAPPPPVE